MRALVLLALAGCLRVDGYRCASDTACDDQAGGRCTGGYCSYPDPSCDGGYRFGTNAGPVANQCTLSGTGSNDGGVADAPVPCTGTIVGTGLVQVCTHATTTRTFNGTLTVDTSDPASCDVLVGGACALVGTSININGTLTVRGTRPLVLASTGTMVLNGTIDASSSAGARGAGANPTACVTRPGSSDQGGGGGGAGGSFGGKGGDGGTGDGDSSAAPAGTAPGGLASAATPTITSVRAGCPGGDGGGASALGGTAGGGRGGDGGGAIYIAANVKITLVGSVYAAGAGGQPGTSAGQGGGGGGTGGLIGLDAPTISVPAGSVLAANGGAGAGGIGTTPANAQPGDDGTTADPTIAALKGLGDTASGGGNGADGSCGTAPNGQSSTTANAGAGGGGGSVGIIWIRGALTTMGTFSPQPQLH